VLVLLPLRGLDALGCVPIDRVGQGADRQGAYSWSSDFD